MIKHKISSLVLRLLGGLLVTAALLKGHELFTLPVANADLWSYRPFLIFQVECELALGLWLLSGLWKRLAWWISLGCFGLFCGVTLYKALTGAASCGCFGTIQLNPWITLLAIDVPAVCLLLWFRTHKSPSPVTQWSVARMVYGGAWLVLLAAGIGVTTTGLVMHVPENVTATFEVLEPPTWINQTLPIMDHIDRAAPLQEGNWLIMLFHYDCPDCEEAMPAFEQIAENFVGNEATLQLALIEVPPYGYNAEARESVCHLARMDDAKKWMIVTPAVLLLADGVVRHAWEEGTLPTFDTVLEHVARIME
jgi:thiol-disulfide isomerase/thioredoxin